MTNRSKFNIGRRHRYRWECNVPTGHFIVACCMAIGFCSFKLRSAAFSVQAWNLSRVHLARPFARPIQHDDGSSCVLMASMDDDGDNGEDNTVKSEDEDWRAFRAKLVKSENTIQEKTEPLDESNITSKTKTPQDTKSTDDSAHWAYDTDGFVERGSIVLSIPSSDPIANDIDALTNQCFRKAIVLVLDVRSDFIQGIILNRPTNIGVKEGMQFVQPGHGEVYENEIGTMRGETKGQQQGGGQGPHPHRWKVWFGGEVGGPFSDYPRVMCLHSITTELGKEVSEEVLPGILLTSFDGAQTIVQEGQADPSDFWLFSGICGWETNSFYKEMNEEGLWRVVSSDGGTILQELNMLRCEEEEEAAAQQTCDVDSDPRNSGLHTWEMLMDMIGREEEARESEESFGDLMLKEWATRVLSFSLREERSSMVSDFDTIPVGGDNFDVSVYDPASGMSMQRIMPVEPSTSSNMVGQLIRASSAKRSPFLLTDQGYHKSLILVLRDDDECSLGVILNHVTSQSIYLDVNDEIVEIPVRYGGPLQNLARSDEDDFTPPLIFLHSNSQLKEAGVGVEVGSSGIFSCTQVDVTNSIQSGLASEDFFMAIQGLSVWKKKGVHSGVLGDVEEGFFELIPQHKFKDTWEILLCQRPLSIDTIDLNLSIGKEAWKLKDSELLVKGPTSKDEVYVFGSDFNVETLADTALTRWVRAFFLEE